MPRTPLQSRHNFDNMSSILIKVGRVNEKYLRDYKAGEFNIFADTVFYMRVTYY